MIIYSSTIDKFLRKFFKKAKVILLEEMKLPVYKKRFEFQGKLYPLHIVCFEKPGVLGYFASENFQIGLSKSLISEPEERVLNVLRHELAHYYQFLLHGHAVRDHGPEYRAICRQFFWDEKVSSAKEKISQRSVEIAAAETEVLGKIKKLLALSNSENPHEAEAATIKANDLMAKHQLSSLPDLSEDSEDEYFLKRVLSAGRLNSKIQAIADIVETFFVASVFHQDQEGCHLEVLGSKEQVEIADYVAKFLSTEFETLYKKAKRDHGLSGARAKNNFFLGIAKGYLNKHQTDLAPVYQKSLVTSKQIQREVINRIYGGTRSSYSKRSLDPKAFGRGFRAANDLKVRKGLKQNQGTRLLSFLKK